MIETPPIGGAISTIGKAAPTPACSNPAGEEGFRSALSSEMDVEPNVLTCVKSEAVDGAKHHRKPAGQKTNQTNKAIQVKEAEGAESAQQATPVVNTMATLMPQEPARAKATSVMSDALPKQAAQLTVKTSGSCTGNSKVSALEKGVAAEADINLKPVLVGVNPVLKTVASRSKPSDDNTSSQPSVSSLPARTASTTAPVGAAVILGGEAGVLHKGARADHVVAATAAPQSTVHAEELKTLTSTPNVLEIGIASGTHGWLRVRAELGQTGEVSASLVTTSSHSAEALHNDLPAMAAYLSTEQIGISSVVVNAAEPVKGANFPQTGSSPHGQADSQRQDKRHADEITFITDLAPLNRPTGHEGFLAFPATGYSVGGGGWLSVRV